ncbi:sodium:solute symporter family protein [Roseimarinus sediminis]|uniref:sodium:solute symporter family protein n=1 Tax=Roseimarinus sediminis TaxID=1610899 RepID=UPI003D1CBACB
MTTIILLLYLALLIAVAVGSFKKVRDFNDFFVARKSGSYRAVSGSLIATILGGSAVIGAIDEGASLGWASSWYMLTAAIGLAALLPLTGRISRLGRFTLPDLLNDLYGRQSRLIASFIIPIAWTGIVAAQLIAAASILQSFTGMSYTAGVWIAALVFIGYTVAGGQLSILKTDAVQSLLILAGLVLVAVFSLQLHDMKAIDYKTPAFPFNSHFKPFDLLILLFTYATTFTAGPDIYSRIFCAANEQVARRAIITTIAVLIPVALIIGFLGTTAASLVSESGTQGAVIIELGKSVLPAWLLPLIVLSLLSAVLSSADTTLLSASIIIAELFDGKQQPGQKSLKRSRYLIVLTGFISLLIALHFHSIIGMLLIALTVYSGAFTLPVLAGLAGIKIKQSMVSAAIITGGLMALSGKLISLYSDPFTGKVLIISAFAVNALLLLAGSKRGNRFR